METSSLKMGTDRDKYILELKYKDENGNDYPNVESFWNRKRKGNILSPREEERIHKLRLTSENYETNKEEENKKEKCKKEEHNKSQKKREEVLEAELVLDITHIFNGYNSLVKLERTKG